MRSSGVTFRVDEGTATQFDVVALHGHAEVGRIEANHICQIFLIGNVWVDETFRRAAVASRMLRRAIAHAATLFPPTIYVYADAATDDGRQFLAALGFDTCEPLPGWAHQGMPMRLQL